MAAENGIHVVAPGEALVTSTITHKDYEALFGDSMRALFNWARMAEEKWPIVLQVVTTREELGGLYLPWWHKPGDPAVQVNVNRPGVQHTVASAAEYLEHLGATRQEAVMQSGVRHVLAKGNAQIFPAARGRMGTVLLDGCHRAVGTYISGFKPHIALFVARPPRGGWAMLDG